MTQSDVQRTTRARRRNGPRIARLALAVLLLAMAAGQLLDLPGFVDAIRDYPLGPSEFVWVVGVGLVLGELIGGGLLLARRERAHLSGAIAALAVAIAWSLLAISAFMQGAAIENCGCFGVFLAQPLRWWILLEDVEFVVLAVWVLATVRAAAAPRTPSTPDQPTALALSSNRPSR